MFGETLEVGYSGRDRPQMISDTFVALPLVGNRVLIMHSRDFFYQNVKFNTEMGKECLFRASWMTPSKKL